MLMFGLFVTELPFIIEVLIIIDLIILVILTTIWLWEWTPALKNTGKVPETAGMGRR